MFRTGGKPAYVLNEIQFDQTGLVYEKMLAEIDSDYPYRYELIRHYVSELAHIAQQLTWPIKGG